MVPIEHVEEKAEKDAFIVVVVVQIERIQRMGQTDEFEEIDRPTSISIATKEQQSPPTSHVDRFELTERRTDTR